MSLRILLTGKSGQVGTQLLPMLQQLGEVTATGSQDMDLARAEQIQKVVRRVRPHWIVNTAAYTAVDRAESEPELAHAVNAIAPGVLGEEAAKLRAAVIHFSTDYVFPGDGEVPWRESDATAPLNTYGDSKLAGERALAQSGATHFIFRASWVYEAAGQNFLRTILRLAQEKPELRIVANQHGAPTRARNLAALAAHTISFAQAQGDDLYAPAVQALQGIYHSADAGVTTWYDFAKAFLAIAAAQKPKQSFATLTPIATADYPTPARRPLNSRLNCERLKDVLGYRMPAWTDSMSAVMEELARQ